MKVSFKIEGMKEIEKALKDIANSVEAVTKEEVRDCALETENRAKENLVANESVVTGTLLRSITPEIEGFEAEVGTNIEYAPYVEMGTRKSRAKPYLWPAFEMASEKFGGKIKGKLEG